MNLKVMVGKKNAMKRITAAIEKDPLLNIPENGEVAEH